MSKISIEEVRNAVEQDGCILISSQYKNLDSDLEIKCPKGHTFFKKYKTIRSKGCICPICEKNNCFTPKPSMTKPKTSKFRILALDQATLLSGWSMWDGQSLIGYGVVEVPHEDTSKRITYVKQWLASMIENNCPDLVVLEDIQLQDFHSNGKDSRSKYDNVGITTFKVLAKLQGVLENLLIENEVDYKIVSPNTWRSGVGIKGRRRPDQKRNAQIMVSNEFHISATEDEADAICIGKYSINTFNKQPTMINWG